MPENETPAETETPAEVECPVELKPMKDWVEEPDPKGVCRECLLGPVLQWYRDELREQGLENFAKELDDLAEKAELLPLQLCETFDRIKSEVEAPLRERLLEFDCAVQSYENDD